MVAGKELQIFVFIFVMGLGVRGGCGFGEILGHVLSATEAGMIPSWKKVCLSWKRLLRHYTAAKPALISKELKLWSSTLRISPQWLMFMY